MSYLALRNVWAEWDRGDPDEVEETLHDVAVDASASPPVRAYAGLLEAYARRRRGDLDGSRARIARLGYVGNWMAVGPFENDGKIGLDVAYDPEKEQELPLNLTHDYDGKNHKPVRWRLLPPASPYGWVDFGSFVRPVEQTCVYASTFVRDARVKQASPRAVSVWAGSAGALRVFWNAVEILHDDKYRDLDPERFAATATLREGWNRLTVKVCGDERPPMISLRVAGADGAPDEHLEVDADPRHSTSQGGAVLALGKGVAAPPSTVEGPVQAFERLAKGDDPGVLEAFARYLGATGSDDPTEHRARELARRAAEKAPTIERLLLAGELAESRNQRASWIDQAEALAAAGHATKRETIDTLLARAAYARGGVNWRDAIPYYERVLALDPDNVACHAGEGRALRRGRPPRHGARAAPAGARGAATQRGPASRDRRRPSRRGPRDGGRRDGRAVRSAPLRRSGVRPRPDRARDREARRGGRRRAGSTAWSRPTRTAPARSQTSAQAWSRLGERARAIAAYRAALDLAPEDTDTMRRARDRLLHRGSARRAASPSQACARAHAAGQGRPRRGRAHRAGGAASRRAVRAARRASSSRSARRRRGGEARRTLVDLQVTTVFPNGLANRFHQVVYQPLTEAAAAESREYEFSYENDSQAVELRAARVYRSGRSSRRSRRERRRRDGGRSGRLDVHERAQLLRALSQARAGRRRRAAVPSRGRGRRATNSPTTSARSSTCRAPSRSGAASTC